jgi:hypothetical protein
MCCKANVELNSGRVDMRREETEGAGAHAPPQHYLS